MVFWKVRFFAQAIHFKCISAGWSAVVSWGGAGYPGGRASSGWAAAVGMWGVVLITVAAVARRPSHGSG